MGLRKAASRGSAALILCRMTDTRATLRLRALTTWWERLHGLLGTDATAGAVALCGCSSIHTFGMRYGIDVALVASNGAVLRSRRELPPRRLLWAADAEFAFERPSSADPWPAEGSWVSIARVGEREGGQGSGAAREEGGSRV